MAVANRDVYGTRCMLKTLNLIDAVFASWWSNGVGRLVTKAQLNAHLPCNWFANARRLGSLVFLVVFVVNGFLLSMHRNIEWIRGRVKLNFWLSKALSFHVKNVYQFKISTFKIFLLPNFGSKNCDFVAPDLVPR